MQLEFSRPIFRKILKCKS